MRTLRSPNWGSRGGAPVSLLVLHYTGMQSAQAAIERLCDPESQVSAHYVIEENGDVTQLVDESANAWHAGVSYWRGARNVNPISVGIEIVNPGHEWGYRPFPKVQMESVASLGREIIARHGITASNVVAHSDIAPLRKQDPGELFDWAWLAAQGVGVWPEPTQKTLIPLEVVAMQRALAEYGYDVPTTGSIDGETQAIIRAFQRHFRPTRLTGEWDEDCAKRLSALLNK